MGPDLFVSNRQQEGSFLHVFIRLSKIKGDFLNSEIIILFSKNSFCHCINFFI